MFWNRFRWINRSLRSIDMVTSTLFSGILWVIYDMDTIRYTAKCLSLQTDVYNSHTEYDCPPVSPRLAAKAGAIYTMRIDPSMVVLRRLHEFQHLLYFVIAFFVHFSCNIVIPMSIVNTNHRLSSILKGTWQQPIGAWWLTPISDKALAWHTFIKK